jgi:hypothetical protein
VQGDPRGRRKATPRARRALIYGIPRLSDDMYIGPVV